jgi:hypothetical protein
MHFSLLFDEPKIFSEYIMETGGTHDTLKVYSNDSIKGFVALATNQIADYSSFSLLIIEVLFQNTHRC